MATGQAISYWFFQYQAGDPEGRDIDSLAIGDRISFRRWPFGSEPKPGDIAYLWRSTGGDVGLAGWATVIVRESDTEKSGSTLGLEIQCKSKQPISRAEFSGLPGLSDAPLIRQVQRGSQFRLSVEQAYGVAEFLRARELPAPLIATEAIVETTTRRIERELSELPKLLMEMRDGEMAKHLLGTIDALVGRLKSANALEYYDDIAGATRELANAIEKSREQGSSIAAPLDAAWSRLMNDLDQLNRFREIPTHSVEQKTTSRPRKKSRTPRKPTKAAAEVEDLSSQDLDADAAESEMASVADEEASAEDTETAAAPEPGLEPQPEPPPSPPPQPPPPAALEPPKDPSFRWWEHKDFIGIGAAVNNLARYIAHEGLVPPRAIGVFGDWGSGKTFFIEALQSQIALLASQSRDALKENRTTVFCSHIVQIEFNAWHYVESNLWASLAAHIFEKLYDELERRAKEEEGNKNVDGLFQQFSAYRQAVNEQKRLLDLVESLTGKREQLQQRKQQAEQQLGNRLAAMGTVIKAKLQSISLEKLTKDQREQLDALLKATNLSELQKASEDAGQVVNEGRTFIGRIRAQMEWWGWPQMALFGGLAAAVIFGLPIVVARLFDQRIDDLTRWMTVAGGYALTAAGAIAKLARGGRNVIDAARKVQDVLDETRKQLEQTPDGQLAKAQHELEAAKSELELLDREVVEQRAQLAKLSDDLDPNRLGTRLREFLEQRAKDGSYQKHLGLVSLVRKDFESLYGLMRRHWDSRKKPTPEVLAEVQSAIGSSKPEPVPFIERIVLYIDDLDRCPEDKVVEVLQAVHLMLGLPLFVVVVAVDVRWVGQSIRKVYGALVKSDSTLAAKSVEDTATADDYLEKIFQIPYRIHPMPPDTRRELLGGLLREPFLASTNVNDTSTLTVARQELVPKELSLYPEEQSTIAELYACVGDSPRRVRRFFDVYRLMRSGMEEGEVQAVIAERHYEVILPLFAMLSGAPLLAPRVIEKLHQDAMRKQSDPALLEQPTLVGWLDEHFPGDPAIQDPERNTVLRAAKFLDDRGMPRTVLADVLRRWIPEVARYSFREVKMRATTVE